MSDITKIKPIKVNKEKSLPVKGKELIPDLYSNIFLAAKTNSGKTTVISHILKHTIDERTTVIIFCSTLNLDDAWINILKSLKKRKINTITYDSLKEDGIDILSVVLKGIDQCVEEENTPEEKKVNQPCFIRLPLTEEMKKVRKKKPKKYDDEVPQFLLILDDLDKTSLRSESIVNTIKKNRHYHMRCIISSQHLLHLSPDAFSQLYMIWIWGGFSQTYIKSLWDKLNLDLSFEDFWEIYLKITEPQYSFLVCDLRRGKLYDKFSQKSLNKKKSLHE